MTTAQARVYFEQFMSEMDGSRDRLADTLRTQGADPALVHDFSPDSLKTIWAAVSPLLAMFDGYTEPDPMQPWLESTLESLGDPSTLPSWLRFGSPGFAPATLWIIDGVGRHLGNVIVTNVPGMRWSVGPNRVRSAYRNWPVVTDQDGEDHNPFEGVRISASRTLEGRTHVGMSSPWEFYEMRAAFWRPDTRAAVESAASVFPPVPSGCKCGEHLGELTEQQIIPYAASQVADEPTDSVVTVADLVTWEALAVEEVEDEPGRWLLWFGDETRAHYDDDAPLSLEDVVASASGVSNVDREDRETIYVHAPGKCADAMLAIAARALLDDRVRIRNADPQSTSPDPA